jgi:heme A synthase
MSLAFIHNRLSITAGLFFLVLALWGFWRFFRKQGIDSSYFGALMIGEILVVLQALVGIIMWLQGARPARGAVHLIYGLLIPAVIPLVYNYTKGGSTRRESLVYGAAIIFGVGLILRAITTGLDPALY